MTYSGQMFPAAPDRSAETKQAIAALMAKHREDDKTTAATLPCDAAPGYPHKLISGTCMYCHGTAHQIVRQAARRG